MTTIAAAASRASAPDHLVETASPPAMPGREQPAQTLPVLHEAQRGEQAERRPGGDEDVEHRDARLGDAEKIAGGEEQRHECPTSRQSEPTRDGVDARQDRQARDDRRQAPAEGPVAEHDDAQGDGELAGLGMPPRDLVAGLPAKHAASADPRGRRRWPWRPWRSRPRRTCSRPSPGVPSWYSLSPAETRRIARTRITTPRGQVRPRGCAPSAAEKAGAGLTSASGTVYITHARHYSGLRAQP